ncbi:putative bifunctional diguanylate cyclase/phosphodiesterase [Spongiibacter sp.]|uniref:putative bifunctional diguanylate cyclase/phosphodiesterase n=1 Tax=Spongiibacter sp. TaxID=2024860 RepID=UPI00356737D5
MNQALPNDTKSPATVTGLSLFQKLCALIIIMIMLIMLGRGYISYLQTMGKYDDQVQNRLQRLEQTFTTLAQRSSHELFRSADRYTQPNGDATHNVTALIPSLMSEVESVAIISKQGQILSSAQIEGADYQPGSDEIQSAVATIATTQQPMASLICNPDCIQSVFIPLISDNGDELIININRSAVLLFEDFYDITGTELVVFSPQSTNAEPDVKFSSHGAEGTRLLNAIAQALNLELTTAQHYFGKTAEGYLAAHFFELPGSTLHLAIISDESAVASLAARTISEVLAAALVTSLLLSLVVYLVLRPPLKKLAIITNALPLLSGGNFSDARQALKKIKRHKKYIDEIDLLHHTTEDVNNALDLLSSNVLRQRNELQEKVHALTEAKQFNEMLFDNSPMVIVTHREDGSIHNLNAMGRTLSGLNNKPAFNANINHWVRDPENDITLSGSLQNLVDKPQKKLQNELPFLTGDGQIRDFLWTHSIISIDNSRLFLSLGVDITETRRAEESLRWLGEHDRVTGLLNRSTFIEEADRHIHSMEPNQYIDLVMVDIDNFSEFNDRFGFDCGDNLLRKFANYISEELGDARLLARTGSGEFCILMIQRNHGQPQPHNLDALSRFQIDTGGGVETISATIIVDHYNVDIDGIDDLLSNATSLMQRMKSKGKGHVYHADDQDSKESRQEKYLLKEQLLEALNSNRLVLFYQPIVDMHSHNVSHCECLVRMLDDEGSFIAPAKFLGIATECGLMPRIDYIVLEKAMRQLAAWQQAGITIQLSINITAPTLEQPDFAERLGDIISATGATPESLIFELVETDALENIENARKLLEQIKVRGAQIALDDFGIGFTSFEYLRELPVDYIKIDQAFIRFINERENDQTLVRSIIEMSHSLGKKVIAEGVEKKAAVEILRDMQVDYIQGYYLSRPVPISALDLNIHL